MQVTVEKVENETKQRQSWGIDLFPRVVFLFEHAPMLLIPINFLYSVMNVGLLGSFY